MAVSSLHASSSTSCDGRALIVTRACLYFSETLFTSVWLNANVFEVLTTQPQAVSRGYRCWRSVVMKSSNHPAAKPYGIV
jgi:hypothetical protein